MQRTANPRTPVQFRPRPPIRAIASRARKARLRPGFLFGAWAGGFPGPLRRREGKSGGNWFAARPRPGFVFVAAPGYPPAVPAARGLPTPAPLAGFFPGPRQARYVLHRPDGETGIRKGLKIP